MSSPDQILALASTGTLAVALGAATFLRGWREWLALRRDLLSNRPQPGAGDPELAELRRRVRRLEAIADGMPGR